MTAYFPNDTWFNLYTGEKVVELMTYKNLSAPLSTINVHVRGGYILPLQSPDITTTRR